MVKIVHGNSKSVQGQKRKREESNWEDSAKIERKMILKCKQMMIK